ncbi:hypothetical protein, partial [Pseudomonas syringae group genomosp. 7]|uniref:hypothetical protein n=1 Tax=Pseudomonas syringae group genomosp. 7 TaxID=251699 RepID=UPI00376FFB7F
YYEWSVSPDDGKKDPWFIHATGPLLADGLWEDTSPLLPDGNKELIAWIVPEFPVPARMLQRECGRDALDLTIRAMN